MAKNTTFEVMQSEFLVEIKQCLAAKNVDSLFDKYSSFTAQDADKKMTLDHVFREHLITLLADGDTPVYEKYINVCIQACRRDMCSATMPVVLLGDVFDAVTLDKCELLFAFVENGVHTWKEECFFSACKNNLLRMCNDLLRRLSRSQNTVFCGRILLFLAKFFPFSERSGLNVVSEFNLDNVTEYGDDKVLTTDKDKMEEDEETDVKPDIKLKIDYNLYCKFWALQDFFRNPNQCYSKLQWRMFISHAGDVLSAFNSFKLEDVQCRSTKKQDNTCDETMQQYFAKYLTNQKLLELQLSDSNFRRYVLLQFLILFQYLCSTVKFRPETDELKPEQNDWVTETTKQVYTLLEETPPDGKHFAVTVKHILKREEHWNAWKNEGCPVFKKPPTSQAVETEPAKPRPTKRLGDQIRDASSRKRFVMGNAELTKLWNISVNNLEACRSKERDFLPSLESYFEEAIQQSDPASMIEEGYKRVNDGNFGWRALRLLARRSPHFFTHSNNPINKLPEYLETMIKRIAKDLPSSGGETKNRELTEEQSQETVEELNSQDAQENQDAEEDELLRENEMKEETSAVAEEVVEEEEEETEDKLKRLTKVLLKEIAKEVAHDWTKLAKKLGYKDDEIEYLQTEHSDDEERANHLLQIWKQDDEDASAPSLHYILNGLGMTDAAKLLE